MGKSTRSQAFRNKAERGVAKAIDGIHAVALAASHYRGYFTPEEAKAITESLRAAVDSLEQSLVSKPMPAGFSWPLP